MTIALLIVDDHAVVRTGLSQLVDGWTDITLVGTAEHGQQALAVLGDLASVDRLPDVVLMDLAMPMMDGVQATVLIGERYPRIRIIVLTSLGEQRQITAALDAGADGYLFKHADPTEIEAAIRTVHEGGAVLDPKAARALLDVRVRRSVPADANPLSSREEEVIRLVRDGLANKQIARRLGIAERTVKAHLTNAFQRLGVTDRTQAALWAHDHLDGA